MDDPQTELPTSSGGRFSDAGSPLAAMVAEADRALKAVEPAAFLVVPRVLRRVMKQVWDLPALTVNVPHRKTWIVRRGVLLKHVDWDELGLERFTELPETSILIARPDDKHLESISLSNLKLLIWRLLFHARMHRAFDEQRESGNITAAGFRERIHRLGQVEFDEIRTVLRRENFTHGESTQADIYIEFAALYCELKYFSPHCLNTYFPSFEDYEVVDELLAEDLDVDGLFQATRLEGAGDPVTDGADDVLDETDQELDSLTGHHSAQTAAETDEEEIPEDGFPDLTAEVQAEVTVATRPNRSAYARLERKAEKAFNRGNAVGAALFLMRAARYAPPELLERAVTGALQDIKRLVRRLQAALEFDDRAARSWYEALVRLLVYSTRGFWNADKRLLYDLQKVCVDHEREIFTVDLIPWISSFGNRPIRRALPNQREVLMSKHLRSATRRLVAARLTGTERRELSHLLHEAAHSAESQMRSRLRPLTTEGLSEVGFVPDSLPERVAFQKMNEELLDGVANRGFLTMGDLRDAISRSNLKLNDLSGPTEFIFGDKLLRADKEFNRRLDGVYQRGDFYLHWLQRLSAVAFGTWFGRFFTRYIAIPYGGAFLAFEAVIHVVKIFDKPPKEEIADAGAQGSGPSTDAAAGSTEAGADTLLETAGTEAASNATEVVHPPTALDLWIEHYGHSVIFALGTFILLVIYSGPFRRFMARVLKSAFNGLRQLFYEWPARVLRKPAVRRFLRSTPVTLLRKFVIWPLVPTAVLCLGLPWLFDAFPSRDIVYWTVVWAAMSVILNSRVGRDVEELSAEWAFSTWNRIRAHIFVALFELIMESFKKLLEWFERVLYAVDEWLRFKSGETTLSLAIKAVLGVFWSAVTFVLRFCVNLLIEPQINPIKHFPVVTVSHKLLLPLTGTFADLLAPFVGGTEAAYAIVTPVIFVVPGIFGFIAWELKSNWQLYRANRGEQLKPVLVGTHGETFIRLMKPGFHSGTLPKLFVKLRRTDRRRAPAEHSLARSKYLDQLHHVHLAVEHFVDRELLAVLRESSEWTIEDVDVERIRLASNNIRVELICPSLNDSRLILVFEEQSGWLVANAQDSGWVSGLTEPERKLLMTALIGFYRLAGVDLVREQIEVALGEGDLPYDVNEEGILVWPESHYDEEATYNLRHTSTLRPYPRAVARTYDLDDIPSENLMFARTELHWDDWDAQWEGDDRKDPPPVLKDDARWPWSDR